ncbi:MAG: phosphoenolpyruvate carboxylase, partial [Archaeoglobaceae archaeon]
NALDEYDYQLVRKAYVNFEDDLKDSLKYFNPDTPFLPDEVKIGVDTLPIDFEMNNEHKQITDHIINSIRSGEMGGLEEYVLRAASLRKFLG